jgi:LAS superfamily LD-carboxypeptidase LdcB
MESNKNIGCRSGSGKTIIVDPNKFDGMDSSNNVSVPLEDLSIYVQLETKKRARTILQDNLSINTGELKVKFIDGEDVSGRKVLTTRYTDLTTSLDSRDDNQDLGISSIDIAFNPSYAPLVTINFIDLRGSAMFQNEALLQNKYAVLFQMPYPIFTLTVKGYYGLPVKYDLHMTKFNAKFNSKTGNFEITASFIGYTYAMLSDMLIGYLRAIAHTQLGAAKYKEIKEKNPYILTLDELITAISKIDDVLKKLASDDPSINDYTVYRERLNQLGQFKDAIISLAVSMGIVTEATEYKFLNVTNVSEDKINEAINNYNASVTENVKIFNDGNDILFSDTELFFSNATTYESLTGDTNTELSTFINTNGIGGTFKIFDLTAIYKQIENKKNDLETKIDGNKVIIGEKIKTAIASALKSDNSTSSVGLQPTIRNIVEIFTTSVEVLLSVLFKVSENAIKNEDRKKQLQKYAPTNENKDTSRYDYNNLTIENNVAVSYFPWPEYREKDEKNGLQEAYLGGINVLEEPSKVDELNFIDDLLNAFYASLTAVQDAEKIKEKEQNLWGSVNPLDTTLYGLTNYPFSRFNKNDPKDVLNTLISRAAIFMGVSNKSLNINDIQTFAALEVQNMKLDVSDTIVKFLSGLNLTGATGTKAFINNVEEPLIKEITIDGSSYYYYNFIFNNNINTDTISDARSFKLLPLNNTSNSFKFEIDKDDTKSFSEAGNLFLTNYTASVFNLDLLKPDDGGVYLKIFTPDEFQTNKGALPSNLTPSLTKISLSDLELSQTDFDTKVSSENILPQFGSNYGLPEFFTVDIPNIGDSPFRTMFFVDNLGYEGGSTLCKNRTSTDLTKYDINNQTNLVSNFTYDNFKDYLYGENRLRDELGQNRLNLNKTINNEVGVSYPYISFGINYKPGGINYTDISLFGSRFYYAQTSEYAKAFLFLHTFPWNGLVGEQNIISCIFKVNEIINTFGNKAAFVSAPRLWAAFVGGLIWRADIRPPIMDEIIDSQQVGGGSGLLDPIKFGIANGNSFTTNYIPNLTDTDKIPNKNEYLHSNVSRGDVKKKYSMSFLSDYSLPEDKYLPIDVMLYQLPEQVKTEFKKAFFDFVNGTNSSWNQIKSKLELVNNCDDELWKAKWTTTPNTGTNGTIFSQSIKNSYNAVYDNGKKVIDNYVMLTKYDKDDFSDTTYNYVSELKDNSDSVTSLLNLMKEEIIISNNSFKIWNQEFTTSNTIDRGAIFIPKETFENYLNAVKINLQTDTKTEEEKQKEKSQQLFGTTNQNLIKFQLYRTCKNIYDKWIGGSASEDTIIFRKDKDNVVVRNGLDVKLAENRAKLKGGDSTPTLIDSFRFVTRSFRDIGDEMYVNPKEVAESIATNPNNSFYDIVTSLLSQNNFNFQPLPNYINYSDENELKNMFKPISGLDTFSQGSTGPAFVCVYVGQPSKHLDFRDSSYQHDGIDFRCRDDGNLEQLNADDFTNEKKDYENNVAVFSVNYSQQNQNLFKDITLDQSEFSETNESLQVIDEIAKKGAENRTTTGGQNLYDVYSVRSYKAEVEMMGNVMIQPMMYFQLNNIPMFHGGYLITNVKHTIRPNHMLTNFTGVRVRNVETPMLDAASLYMPLLESLLGSESADGKSVNSSVLNTTDSKADYPIINTIRENGFQNGNPVDSGNIILTKLIVPKGIKNLVNDNNNKMVKEAADSLTEMLKDWVSWMSSNQFTGQNGSYANVNSIFRTYQQQQQLEKSNGTNAAQAGTSRHGFGIAIDFQFFKKNGEIIRNYVNGNPNVKVGYDLTQNESLVWLLDNSYTYGWIIPEVLRDNTGTEEFWHFEYHGKSAACILSNFPVIKGRQINTKKPYKAIVKNPRNKDGTEAIYNSCTKVKNKTEKKRLDGAVETTSNYVTGNAADYWSLVAICALENDNNQGRCDVAQSIYNRLQSGVYGEDTIKGLILADNQYEPVDRAVSEFRAIKDRQTAIRAFAKSKNTSTDVANNKIQETIDSLKNPEMINSSRNFIGGRTDFYSTAIQNRPAEKATLAKAQGTLVTRFNQIFGWFVGPGSKNYGKTNPQPAPKPNFGGLG